MKKILITGANGLLGQKLVDLYKSNTEIQLIATGRSEDRNADGTHTYEPLDITSRSEVLSMIEKHKPNIVINTAAMTQVDQCEINPADCLTVNVDAVKYLAEACEVCSAFFIHLSTDFIFDGKNGPYTEDDLPNPLSTYGESKLKSERILQKSGLKHAVIRTVLVYGIVKDMSRSNIILWVKKSLEEKKNIRVVNDQWRTPTLAEDLAKGCALIAEKELEGVFNISGRDLLTPYDIAIATADFFDLDKSLIEEVDGSIFTEPAKRPAKTGFILDKAKRELGYEPVSFNEGLSILNHQLANV